MKFLSKIKEKIKLPVFWEITIFAAFLVLINFIFLPNDIGYHTLALNPFLLVILLAVMRYGAGWGFYAVVISTAYYFFTPPYSLGNLLVRLPYIALYFVLLLIFGAIQAKYSGKIKDQQDELDDSKQKLQTLNERFEVTSFLQKYYEKKILTQTATMADLYSDARNMQALKVEELFDKILSLVQSYVESDKCSIYILEGNVLRLKSYLGYSEYEQKPKETISIIEEPFSVVFEKHEVLSIDQERFKETMISDLPVYIGPLTNESGDVIGAVTVDSINLLKFNKLSKKVFTLICEWSSKAISNALEYKVSEGRRIISPETHVFKYQYFNLRLDESYLLAKNTGASFALVLVELADWDKIPESNKKSVLMFASRIFQQNMREYDILCHLEQDYEFAIIMSQADDKAAKKLIENTQKQLELYSLKPFGDERILRLYFGYASNFAQKAGTDDIVGEAVQKIASNKRDASAGIG